MAAFGSIQLLLGNGKFLWFYEHPFTDTLQIAKGGFTNANHFAHFIALGLPIWLWKLATVEKESSGRRSRGSEWRSSQVTSDIQKLKTILAAGCLAVIGAGLLLSQSRGGIATGSIGAAVTLFFLWRQGLIGAGLTLTTAGWRLECDFAGILRRQRRSAGAAESRGFTTTDVEKLDQGEARRKIWGSAVAAAKEFPIAGTGLSSHVEVYPTYYDGLRENVNTRTRKTATCRS